MVGWWGGEVEVERRAEGAKRKSAFSLPPGANSTLVVMNEPPVV